MGVNKMTKQTIIAAYKASYMRAIDNQDYQLALKIKRDYKQFKRGL